MEPGLYYQSPPDTAFDEMKRVSLELWSTMDNEYGYVDEKTTKVNSMQNVKDNFMYLFAMFDHINQAKAVSKLSDSTKRELRDRMIDGGNHFSHLEMLGL